jgi:hypothetical protein
VVRIESLGGVEKGSELLAIEALALGGMDLRSADVLGWIGRNPPVDVGEAVEAKDRGQSPVDGRRSEAPLLHRGSIQLDVGALGFEDGQMGIRGPLEKAPQVVAVGVKCSAAVPGQVGRCRQLSLVEERVLGQNDECS